MDIKEKFNITEKKQYYYNYETGSAIEYNAPEEKKIVFLKRLLDEIIDDPATYGVIKYLNEKTIKKIFEEEKLKPVKRWDFNPEAFIMPLLINWNFYENENKELYLDIYFVSGDHNNENFHHFWFKCFGDEEKTNIYLIYPFITFELELYLYFEDGGKVLVEVENIYKVEEVGILEKSQQAEFFIKNYSEEDIKILLL